MNLFVNIMMTNNPPTFWPDPILRFLKNDLCSGKETFLNSGDYLICLISKYRYLRDTRHLIEPLLSSIRATFSQYTQQQTILCVVDTRQGSRLHRKSFILRDISMAVRENILITASTVDTFSRK